MAGTKRFEETEIWQDSMTLCTTIYSITQRGELKRDFGLRDQLRRSSVSIPSTISEGFERELKRQLIYFLMISKGSCGELNTAYHCIQSRIH